MSEVMIASGHDEDGTALPLSDLDPPKFELYTPGTVFTEWNTFESTEWNGVKQRTGIGRPYVTWLLFRLTDEEYAYFISEFCPNKQSAPVTIYTLDKDENEWKYFNATLVPPTNQDRRWDVDGWDNVKFFFYDLEEIEV